MLRNIKLQSVIWVLGLILTLTGSVYLASDYMTYRNVSQIKDAWGQFQSERAIKGHLVAKLRKTLGYGGMIHAFKNYVLRGDRHLVLVFNQNAGSALDTLDEYETLDIDVAEEAAIADIRRLIEQYSTALDLARDLAARNVPVNEIDIAVQVDDRPALRGLLMLLQSTPMHGQSHQVKHQHSKSVDLSGVYAALGYGGLIHEFKNLIIRGEADRIPAIKAKLAAALQSIEHYRSYGATPAESIALDDISNTIALYRAKVDVAASLIEEGRSPEEIDQAVKVDDAMAFRGFSILEREIATQIAVRSSKVDKAISFVLGFAQWSGWLSMALIILSVILGLLFVKRFVITPVRHITDCLTELASGNVDIPLKGISGTNEIAEMSKAVETFRDTILQRREADENLSAVNDELKAQVRTTEGLKTKAEEQAAKAVSLAEHLAEARKSTDDAFAQSEAKERQVRLILDTVLDAIVTADQDGKIISFNRAAETIFGYREGEALGQSVEMLMPESFKATHPESMQKYAHGRPSRMIGQVVEYEGQRKDGSTFPIEISANSMSVGGKQLFTAVMRDITTRKRAEEEILHLAMTDPLTGLANRNQFQSRIKDAFELSKRLKQPFALLLVDLDKFKPVNDTYGHPVGDEVLQQVAEHMTAVCREVDTVARLGGDEFAILLMAIDKAEDAVIPAERLIELINAPITIEGHEIRIGASIGISVYDDGGVSPEVLFKQADNALYQSKDAGRNTYRFFEHD